MSSVTPSNFYPKSFPNSPFSLEIQQQLNDLEGEKGRIKQQLNEILKTRSPFDIEAVYCDIKLTQLDRQIEQISSTSPLSSRVPAAASPILSPRPPLATSKHNKPRILLSDFYSKGTRVYDLKSRRVGLIERIDDMKETAKVLFQGTEQTLPFAQLAYYPEKGVQALVQAPGQDHYEAIVESSHISNTKKSIQITCSRLDTSKSTGNVYKCLTSLWNVIPYPRSQTAAGRLPPTQSSTASSMILDETPGTISAPDFNSLSSVASLLRPSSPSETPLIELRAPLNKRKRVLEPEAKTPD